MEGMATKARITAQVSGEVQGDRMLGRRGLMLGLLCMTSSTHALLLFGSSNEMVQIIINEVEKLSGICCSRCLLGLRLKHRSSLVTLDSIAASLGPLAR